MIDRNKHWPVRHWGGHWAIGHWPRLVAVVQPTISTDLRHSPAYILREHLVGAGVIGDISDVDFWPAYVCRLPAVEGNVVSIYDTTPVVHYRVHEDVYALHWGVQVILKSEDYETGLLKMEDVANECEGLEDASVSVSSALLYIIRTCAFTTGIIYVGLERRTGRRHIFSLNMLAVIDRII